MNTQTREEYEATKALHAKVRRRYRRSKIKKPIRIHLNRDCRNCYTPVPMAIVTNGKRRDLPEAETCPHCGAPFPLRD